VKASNKEKILKAAREKKTYYIKKLNYSLLTKNILNIKMVLK
jgi:hypothetical protein